MTEISNLNLLAEKDSPTMDEFADKELERRLSLYQVFLKLYEHHTSLLDEILQLENSYQPGFAGAKPLFIQGIVDASAVYAITNLCDSKTQILKQSQMIWTMGRDRSAGIYVADRYVSRRHAAIQYIENQGFYLVDFKSTNGSYVNGEPVYQQRKLSDGDKVRLGKVTFSFFINDSSRVLPTVAIELLMQLTSQKGGSELEISSFPCDRQKPQTETSDETLQVSRELAGIGKQINQRETLSIQQRSDILERFLSIRGGRE
jgi:pSer/pThr/pTyr-binding forkhead associated (FHA) protein